ncbi:MAG: hypothetical protein A2252_06910 [Elusimicrobia bacterium RIFOXYA2_FULL_39_19]|nr:MAG: hypothetical protein A2252_06910 [Elusimicrobia bacterium RIFOXYA2_FULL_39_19]
MKKTKNLPNILLILTDQHRYDSVGINGNNICKTPNLDNLAREGVRFEQAYTPCALCTPARASIFTGRYPHNHGLWNNCDMFQYAKPELPDSEVLFNQILKKDKNYNCGYVGKWHIGTKRGPSFYGFEGTDFPGYGYAPKHKDYQDYLKSKGLKSPYEDKNIKNKLFGLGGKFLIGGTIPGPAEATVPSYLAQRSSEMIKKYSRDYNKKNKPFFITCSFWGPHEPYLVPEELMSIINPEDIPEWGNFRDKFINKPEAHKKFAAEFWKLNLGWKKWRKIVALYWAHVYLVDMQIGRILKTLDECGLKENTQVVFTTDHGDMVGAHAGIFDKGPFMYEETYRIPMIMRWPGRIKEGQVSDKLVSLLDLAPTFLAIAGIKSKTTEKMDGKNLLPLVTSKKTKWRDSVVAESHGHHALLSQRMIRWNKYKYVFSPYTTDELYDLKKDPYELTNLVQNKKYRNLIRNMKKKLSLWMNETKDPIRASSNIYLS